MTVIGLLIVGLAPIVTATHWGQDIRVSVSPLETKAARNVTFAVTVENVDHPFPLTICQVEILFGWRSASRIVSTASEDIPTGGSRIWMLREEIPPLDPGSYPYTVTVSAAVLPPIDPCGDVEKGGTIGIVPNTPPVASFSFSPATPAPNALVRFSDNSSDADGTVVAWDWDFGDESTSVTQNPTHQFASAGTYQVVLTVTDDDGSIRSAAQEVHVLANAPPVASFSFSPSNPTANTLVYFSDESSDPDPDGMVVDWAWDFGDETTSDLQNPTHQFASAGAYQVVLTVTDDDGGMRSAARNVQVRANVAPVSRFSYSPTSANTSTLIQFTDQSSDPDGSIVRWRWEFKDGTSSNERNPVHQFLAAGVYQVALTVTDNDGTTNSVSHNVQIAAVPTVGGPGLSGAGIIGWGLAATAIGATAIVAVLIVKRKFLRPARRWGQAANKSSSEPKSRWRPP